MTPQPDRPSTVSGEPSSNGTPDETPELSEDEIFHLLQTSRRREAIRYLLSNEGPVKMGDLAEIVSAKEHGTTVEQLNSTQRQRVYIPLYQKHLPKLDEKGVIEYDQSRGIVRPTDGLEIFRPHLEVADPADRFDDADTGAARALLARAASRSYSLATGTSVSLFVASVMRLVTISGQTLAAIVTTLFLLATVAANYSHSGSLNDSGKTRRTRLFTNR